MLGCAERDLSLDSAIPRIESPLEKIAYLRTKWRDGVHIETTFYDSQNRAIEIFSFGRSSSKVLNHYEGNKLATSICYEHSDSSEPGFATTDTLRLQYDGADNLVQDAHFYGTLSGKKPPTATGFVRRYLEITASGDTMVRKEETNMEPYFDSTSTNLHQWERDECLRVKHYHRLYVIGMAHDTVYNFSQRFAYDAKGRLKMAWFDHMYLGQSYQAEGPDTIWYRYNSGNQLIEEKQRYTIDMRNKQAFDESKLTAIEKESINVSKKQFFTGYEWLPIMTELWQ